MKMKNGRSGTRFVRNDVAIAVALVIASFSPIKAAIAQASPADNLPTLVDPAGIIDPELLSTLNSLFEGDSITTAATPVIDSFLTELTASDARSADFGDEVIDQSSAATIIGEPELAAATPVVNTVEAFKTGDDSPSTFDPMVGLEESDLLRDKLLDDDGDRAKDKLFDDDDNVLAVSESDVKDKVGDGANEGSENSLESASIIDAHLPPPEMPEIVLSDEDLPTLRFSDMLALSLVDNPGIIMAEERVIQAREQYNQVGAFRYPSVAMTGTVGPEYNDPVASEESGVATTVGKNVKLTVTQQLYDGGAARSNFNRSQRLINAAEAESQIELESLLLEIVVSYVDYWRFQVELSQAEKFVTVMNELVEDLNSMFKAGATSKLEVDFARARVASARGAESEAAASRNNAFSELEYLVPGLSKFTANSPEKFSDFILLSLEDYLEKGALTNSGFMINQMNTEATELKVRAAKGTFRPTVNMEISGSYIDDEGQPSEPRIKAAAKFLINYTLYNGGERRAAVRRAQAQLRELQSERLQLEREVFREIDQSFNNITASRLALDAVNDEIIANEELQRLNRQNLALGTVNIMELIDVEERLFNASSRKYEVIATMYQEYFSLLVSAGFTQELLAKYELELASSVGS